MKYKKGTFVVIPNKQYLKGKPSEMQSIYFWLCEHANDSGSCFPTKDTIGEEAGCSHNTVDKYLKQLVDEGFLKIKQRRKPRSMELLSNEYQVLIVCKDPNLVQPKPKTGLTPTPNNGSETNLSINSPNLNAVSKADEVPQKEKEPYSFIVELNKLKDGGYDKNNKPQHRKDLKVIALYWSVKGYVFENQKQFNSALVRELRPANLLTGYSGEQLVKAMEYCKKFDDWSLYAVHKRISDVVNKK